ncbi:MAG: ABC transporter permease [Ruminococcaceae bacterium]|nr:ABC transporter permease [Oscillospiraceae bacterium]
MSNKKKQNDEQTKDTNMTLDDAARVKVLSPARLVFKRFIRNKLAIFGICILLLLFVFCFVGPLFYPYSETDMFFGWREQNGDYAYAQLRTEFVSYWNPDCDSDFKKSLSSVERNVNSTIKKMVASEDPDEALRYRIQSKDGVYYDLVKLSDEAYALTDSSLVCVADFVGSSKQGVATFREGYADLGSDFSAAAAVAIRNDGVFEFDGKSYSIVKDTKGGKLDYDIYCEEENTSEPYYYFVSTVLSPAFYGEEAYYKYDKDSGFKYNAYLALYTDVEAYTYDGVTYTTAFEDGTPKIRKDGTDYAFFSDFVASRKGGETALDIEFRLKLEEVIVDMHENASGVGTEVSFTMLSPKVENGKEVLDENGDKVLADTEYTVKREQNDYSIWRIDSTYVIRIYESPSAEHLLGTDANGMDVLARVMYGGRISLLVGFVVVFIEMFIGIIMGGIAGYFGGWVDNVIMRMVDVFYCIPSMPILIITGALFDELNMNYITRLIWMMAILGLLGWAGVARLVRGQILSLREQEFMVAAEASGLSTRRRIFSHLVPNVMPQLIVQATMGLGGVIITESTLSFLGLGVKHPLATWGNMMNNITQKVEYLSAYAYIWVPIGCLICLAVIAFNFVGDGLRDAFDPKMKR